MQSLENLPQALNEQNVISRNDTDQHRIKESLSEPKRIVENINAQIFVRLNENTLIWTHSSLIQARPSLIEYLQRSESQQQGSWIIDNHFSPEAQEKIAKHVEVVYDHNQVEHLKNNQ